MEWYETAYAVIGITSLILLVLTFVLGEFFDFAGMHLPDWEIGGHDVFAQGDVDAPSMISGRILFASFVGFSAFGIFAAGLGWPGPVTLLAAFLGMFLTAGGTFYGVVKPLHAQEHNAQIGRDSYVGLPATVVFAIRPGDHGEVSLVDNNRTRVTLKAWTLGSTVHLPGTTVTVKEVTPTGVIV